MALANGTTWTQPADGISISRELANIPRRLKFYRKRRRHFRHYAPDVRRAPDPAAFSAFLRDGVVVFKRFLAEETVNRIKTEIMGPMESVREGRYDGELVCHNQSDGGVYRLLDVHTSLSPTSGEFFENSFIDDMANALSPSGMKSLHRYVDYKVGVGKDDVNLNYHIDNWQLRFKAFLLLTDVTADQAPFVYVKGSHRRAKWRTHWEWRYHSHGPEAARLEPREVRSLQSKHGFDEETYTGEAGDLILANTSGIHRGSVLRSGSRLQLVNLFVMNEG